jgi:hypothetical protein
MYRVVMLALCACNQVFGSDPVRVVDAHYFDAVIDGATHCPAVGMTPVFSPQLHGAIDQDCDGYEISGDRASAIAECSVGDLGIVAIFEGPQDQPLTQVATLPTSDDVTMFEPARLSPEGDLIILTTFDLVATTSTYRTYTRDATGWTRGADLPFPQFNAVSTPSRGQIDASSSTKRKRSVTSFTKMPTVSGASSDSSRSATTCARTRSISRPTRCGSWRSKDWVGTCPSTRSTRIARTATPISIRPSS